MKNKIVMLLLCMSVAAGMLAGCSKKESVVEQPRPNAVDSVERAPRKVEGTDWMKADDLIASLESCGFEGETEEKESADNLIVYSFEYPGNDYDADNYLRGTINYYSDDVDNHTWQIAIGFSDNKVPDILEHLTEYLGVENDDDKQIFKEEMEGLEMKSVELQLSSGVARLILAPEGNQLIITPDNPNSSYVVHVSVPETEPETPAPVEIAKPTPSASDEEGSDDTSEESVENDAEGDEEGVAEPSDEQTGIEFMEDDDAQLEDAARQQEQEAMDAYNAMHGNGNSGDGIQIGE